MDADLLQRPPLGGLIILLFVAGCSAEQAYNTGQAWQRNQCAGISDKAEHDRCVANTGGSYESYKRETARP